MPHIDPTRLAVPKRLVSARSPKILLPDTAKRFSPTGVIPHPVLYRIRGGFIRESSLVSVDGCGIKRKRLTVVVVEFGMGRCKFHSLDWAARSGRFPYTSNPIWRRSEN